MTDLTLIVLVIIGVMLVLLVPRCLSTSQENYGTVLGQLAPYREQINECVKQCERSDPLNRLLPQGNVNCGVYCESLMTEMANRGFAPDTYPIETNLSRCEKQCVGNEHTTHEEKRKCISVCHGQREVGQWCKETLCPYSRWPEEKCMEICIATNNVNNINGSWVWEMEK